MRIRIMRFNKERQMRIRAFINRQSKRATSVVVHICMILGVTLYTIFGALIMQRIESQQIQKHKLHQQQNQHHQQHLIGKRTVPAVQQAHTIGTQHHQIRYVKMLDHEGDCLGPIIKALRHTHCNESALRQLDHCYRFLTERQKQHREEARQLDEIPPIRFGWSFTDSVLFCFTVITTIGYGNVAPKTFQGRLFCILYALIGIPFTLLAIADLGKFLSEILDGWERTCRSAKKEIQLFWRDFRAQPKKYSFISLINAQNNCILDPNNNNPSFMERLQAFRGNKSNATTPGTDNNPFEEALLDKAEKGEASADGNSKTGQPPENDEENANDDESQQPYERSQTIPLLIMFIVYVFIGGFLLSAYEPDMNFFKAIYFNFVSLTSIGLGDVVPQSEAYMAFTLLYIAIGLALTTIAVEIAADYLKKLHYFGRKIENVGKVTIWFGSKRLTVKQLVKNLGDQFNLPVHQIKTLDLDNFVDNAIKVEEGELETLRAPPFEPAKEEELTYADDEAIIEWEPQKTPSISPEPEEQPPPAEEPEPGPEPEPEPEPETEPEPEPTPEPEPEEEAETVEELAIGLTETDDQSLKAPTSVEQSTPSSDERRKSNNYSDEAWRRYLEYQKQWKKFRHTQTAGGASSVADLSAATPRSPMISPRSKISLDTKASTSARGAHKLSTAVLREQAVETPLKSKKSNNSRTSADSTRPFGQKMATNRGTTK